MSQVHKPTAASQGLAPSRKEIKRFPDNLSATQLRACTESQNMYWQDPRTRTRIRPCTHRSSQQLEAFSLTFSLARLSGMPVELARGCRQLLRRSVQIAFCAKFARKGEQ